MVEDKEGKKEKELGGLVCLGVYKQKVVGQKKEMYKQKEETVMC